MFISRQNSSKCIHLLQYQNTLPFFNLAIKQGFGHFHYAVDMPIDIRATHNVLGHDYAAVYTDRDNK